MGELTDNSSDGVINDEDMNENNGEYTSKCQLYSREKEIFLGDYRSQDCKFSSPTDYKTTKKAYESIRRNFKKNSD